jgi:hypothetical protein
MTAHVITGSAWSAEDTDATWPVAVQLGRLFERDVTVQRFRPVDTAWVTAQYTIVSTVCLEWWKCLSEVARDRMEAAGHIVPRWP